MTQSEETKLAIMMQKISDTIDSIKKDIMTIKNNGDNTTIKVREHEIFIATVKGGKIATRGIWGFLSVFIIAGLFGLWNMYIQVNAMAQVVETMEERHIQQIRFEVSKEVSSYFIKE